MCPARLLLAPQMSPERALCHSELVEESIEPPAPQHPANLRFTIQNSMFDIRYSVFRITPHPNPDSRDSRRPASRFTLHAPRPVPAPPQKKQPIHFINPSFCPERLSPAGVSGDYFVNLIYYALRPVHRGRLGHG